MKEVNQSRSAPDTAADLTALAAWIDEQLGDETADQQRIAERAAARVRAITRRMPGYAKLERRAGIGPFESEQQVFDLPAVQAIYEAMRATTRPGVMAERGHQILCEAATAAGVELRPV